MKRNVKPAVLAFALTALSAAVAKVPPEKAAQLDGPKLTCMGAERAGSADGVAPYTGKYLGSWPGMTQPYGYQPGPYASEKPLFTITAQNMGQYADKLTEGEKGLLKKYPQSYRMNVYPSHRDFRFADYVCQTTKLNATTAEVIHEGKGITGTSGSIPFAFPQGGLEAIWNIINPPRAWTEKVVYDVADVYANGSTTWGKNKFMTLNPNDDPSKRGSYTDKFNAFFYTKYLEPARERDFTAVGYQPNDFEHDATQSWQYVPGLRRVRQAPEVGFDYPVPPAGLRTVDDDYGFNGSPERYTWKLIGKKEFYVPYDNFKVNDPAIPYSDLIKAGGTINPDYERYELHRVWVLEGTLRPGVRHIYPKRILYADEDTWLTVWADNYDKQNQLWRVTLVNFFYSQESKTFHRSATIYHDLTSGTYEATYLSNGARNDWWRINTPLTPADFSPDSLARSSH